MKVANFLLATCLLEEWSGLRPRYGRRKGLSDWEPFLYAILDLMRTRAIYAGSFDLLTVGHIWMIEQGNRLFDELVIGVGRNPDKKAMFTLPERVEMIYKVLNELPLRGSKEKVVSFESYLFNLAEEEHATHILRGVRNSADFEYERVMRNLNGDFHPDIQTVFLVPPRNLAEVSSSVVKGLIGPDGWQEIVKRFVPESVFEVLTNQSA